jgi:L-iditol 2-dehydrogenase
MKAVLFFEPKNIKLVEVPTPEPGPGEVLLKVGSALTCGTDFKAYRQGHHMLGKPPSPFGHELAGTVEAVGEGVTAFKAGDRVVAANSAPCDGCFFCARGQTQLCDDLKLHNGAYAQYNLLPARIVKHNLYKLPSTLGFAEAALSEPLSCAIHAVDHLAVSKGETAAIIGAGSMSLLLISALRARGARVLVVGRNPANLEIARDAGANETVSTETSEPLKAILELTSGRGADCVFEAVGTVKTWQMAIELTRKGGRVCLFGGCASGTSVPIDAHRVHYSQISLHGVFHHTPKYFKAAVDLLSSAQVKTNLLINGRIPLEEVPSFFHERHTQSNRKVAVIP